MGSLRRPSYGRASACAYMKTSMRTALLIAGAFGFLLLLALGAQADIVDLNQPYSPTQPKQPETFLPTRPSPAPTVQPPEEAPPAAEAPAPAPTPVVEAPVRPAPAPTPAREHIVTKAVRPIRSEVVKTPIVQGPLGPFQQVIGAVNTGLRHVGVFLGEVVSACEVGFAAGTGGPVLVLAVLGMAAALERRRAFMARLATDEDVPEFLYAWDVIAPG